MSMDSSGLLARTSRYQIRESSPLRPDNETETPISDETSEYRPLSRRRDSDTQRTIPPPVSDIMPRTLRHSTISMATSTAFTVANLEIDPSTSQPCSLPSEIPGFTVTTTCTDPSSDEEEPSSAATLADRVRRDRLPPPHEISSDEDTEDGLERAMRRARAMGITSNHDYRINKRKTEPSRIEVKLGEGDVLAPHARFFIERERSVVSLKFDPPVYVSPMSCHFR